MKIYKFQVLLREILKTMNQELHLVVRWIVMLIAIFQTRFFLTEHWIEWLLKFLSVLLSFLGKYSPKIAEIAVLLPTSLYRHDILLTDGVQERMFAICKSCDSLYKFEECLHKVGSTIIAINRCSHKIFKKHCNTFLMKNIVTSSGHEKHYPQSLLL